LSLPFNNMTFLLSAHNLTQCPEDKGREIAIAGRSNVGKSSVLNVISNNHKLARTSKSPGRTQLLNFFLVTDRCRLVDLPGYGFARVPANVRLHWGKLLQSYFEKRRSLAGLVLVMDVRHPLRPFDRQMLSWCEAAGLPVHILLNKADKLSRSAGFKVMSEVAGCYCDDNKATIQLFSVLQQSGIEELKEKLNCWFA
jgi:GTP-binding protein